MLHSLLLQIRPFSSFAAVFVVEKKQEKRDMVQQHCIGASHDSYVPLGQPPESKESMQIRASQADKISRSSSPAKCVRASRWASFAVSDSVREESKKANTSTSFSFGVKSNAEYSGQSFLDIIATYSANFEPNWFQNVGQSFVESYERE